MSGDVVGERVRREPAERMWRIHEHLVAGAYPNCTGLAREFEVSYKTVARDVGYMRDHFDLPIEYDVGRHGFFYTKAVEWFPGASEGSDTEMFVLAVARKAVEQWSGLPIQRTLDAGFKKMARRVCGPGGCMEPAFLDAVSFHSVGTDMVDGRVRAAVTKAAARGRGVEFDYQHPGAGATERMRVRPYHVACVDNRFYLLGHDEERREVERFAVNRITGVVLTAKRFRRPKSFDANRFLSGGSDGDCEVLVEFDACATDLMRGRRWYEHQVVAELEDGRSVFSVKVASLDEVQPWVLSWGAHARVIEPVELKERVLRAVGEMEARYRARW